MRHGPKVKSIYSCFGCAFYQYMKTEDGDEGFACHEPSVVEEYNVPQFVLGMRNVTPRWCPFLDQGDRS